MSQHQVKVFLVHGFNVTKPGKTVGKLEEHFKAAGFVTEMFRYGHLGLWGVRKRNITLAKKLAQHCFDAHKEGFDVCVVGHSNGSTIAHIAAEKFNAPIDVAVLINPALKKDIRPCPTARLVHVYHNYKDVPVVWAKWLRRVAPWDFDARPWGEMGREGYTGKDMTVYNFDTLNDFLPGINTGGHSGLFTAVEYFGPVIVSKTAIAFGWYD